MSRAPIHTEPPVSNSVKPDSELSPLGMALHAKLGRGGRAHKIEEIRGIHIDTMNRIMDQFCRGTTPLSIFDKKIDFFSRKVEEHLDSLLASLALDKGTRNLELEINKTRKRHIVEFKQDRELAKYIVREYIREKEHPKLTLLSPDEKWQELERFAREHGGIGVAQYGKVLFPEARAREAGPSLAVLPATAPELWVSRKDREEKPPTFVRRVYGEWLGKGFTRATLRHLDPALDQAIANWRRRHEWPADIDLPTLKEQNTRWVERLEKEGVGALLPSDSPEAALREGRRLATLKHRRAGKGNEM